MRVTYGPTIGRAFAVMPGDVIGVPSERADEAADPDRDAQRVETVSRWDTRSGGFVSIGFADGRCAVVPAGTAVAYWHTADACDHPAAERSTVTYGAGGYLGVPSGPRSVCDGCGWDFGPAAEAAA